MATTIICGDSRDELIVLATRSVNCIVTSPPYWGLRDYGTGRWEGGDPACDHAAPMEGGRSGNKGNVQQHAGRFAGPYCRLCGARKIDDQIGLEASVAEHIKTLVEVFREARRVLRDDGTLWLNYGDAYASAPNGRSVADSKVAGSADDRTFRDKPISTVGGGFKAKDRMLLPARLAIALQEDGWWVRDEIIWHKPNPMPSSVKDRTTPAHEMIYMLSKRSRYYYDQEAILEEAAPASRARLAQNVEAQAGSIRANGGVRAYRPMKAVKRGIPPRHAQYAESSDRRGLDDVGRGMPKNKRSVWTVAPKGFKEAHFATFPPDLIEPCILAGCPVGGTVLDPFFGAGTTGLVAEKLGRNCIGIELSPAYVEIAKKRLGIRRQLTAAEMEE